ncbi:unnamed protein product [Rotaria magnacalcarata]|uniref:ATPase AAA-type core domain-containing protein n=1 Tax=Rotaria magnacalcarata TaxID=392030 RepID=A0A816Q849_9BILA|nr:unnamed protein product [Rotaria magnacalcarata]
MSSIIRRRLIARYSINIIANPNYSFDTRMQVPEEYLGLLHHLHMINVNTCSVKFIPNSRCWTKQDDHQDELMNYFITTTGEQDLLISPNIYLHIQKGDTPNTKDHVLAHQFIGILHYKITLYSYKLTLKQLKAVVTEWVVTYRNYIKNKNKGDDKNVPKDPLTLSFLLNLIDGIIEQPSRILIMTTNHPEQIDPALLRPGRINIKQEFKRCPKPIIKDIIEFFFNQEKSQLDVSQLHDYTYSPADVVSACMSASNGKSTVQLLAEQALSNVVVEAEKTLACNEQ